MLSGSPHAVSAALSTTRSSDRPALPLPEVVMQVITRSSSCCCAVALLASTLACTGKDMPTSPRLVPAAASFAAVEMSGTGVLSGSGRRFLDCIGEVGILQSDIPYRFHSVVTPSGAMHFTDSFIPGEASGSIVGESTGRVWTLQRAISPEVSQTTGAGESSFFTTNNWYTSETGPTLNFHNTLRFRQNADGQVTVDDFEIRCITH
jgi:hypothetical protein